jgi:hypothetical protein
MGRSDDASGIAPAQSRFEAYADHMGENFRLGLRPNFGEPITSGAGFIGRGAEVSRLTAVLRHRASATVLVSGHRGVGKTPFVDEVTRRTKSIALPPYGVSG